MTGEIIYMEYWQYVCVISSDKLLKPDESFLKRGEVTLQKLVVNFTNEI